MRAPALLRFEQDTFMDELAQTLAHRPGRTRGERRVGCDRGHLPPPGARRDASPRSRPSSSSSRPPTATSTWSPRRSPAGCRDCPITTSTRPPRRRSRSCCAGSTTTAPSGPGRAIRPIRRRQAWAQLDPSAVSAVAGGEDLLPLFPVCYQSGDKQRRIYVGLVPTSSGDTFKAAGALSPLAAPGSGSGGARRPTRARRR